MGVFSRFKKHSPSDETPNADMPPIPEGSEMPVLPNQEDIPTPGDLPPLDTKEASQTSSTDAIEDTSAGSLPALDELPPLDSAPLDDHTNDDEVISVSHSSPLEEERSIESIAHPIPLHESFSRPETYTQAPEGLAYKKQEPVEVHTPAPKEAPEEPVHMEGKIHVPEPKEDELIVSEVFVEREHFMELLAALHIARHELEHNLTAKLTLDETESKLQGALSKLHDAFDKMQQNTLKIENEIAKQQG